ncbi:MAG: hypothetical protein IJG50_02380 [Clostridia bacterium]|nr:hypothetical protein [Clostridia bacterium]
MKKLIALILALAMVFAFAACSNNGDETPASDTSETTDTENGSTETAPPEISAQLRADFEKAFEGAAGVHLTPVAYFGETSSGTAFLARVEFLGEQPETFMLVYLTEDDSGVPLLSRMADTGVLTHVSSGNESGGWGDPESPVVTDELHAIFDRAFEDHEGAPFIPLALVSQQVVGGMNYCFFCQTENENGDPANAFVYIYTDLGERSEITDIIPIGEQ